MKAIPYNKTILFFFFVIFLAPWVRSQEVLTGVASSKQSLKSTKETDATYADTLALPFIEDFARGVGYPTDGLWEDDFAYMNYQYPVNPPSIGVATMDALDAEGFLYPGGSSSGFEADKLTSRPIDLDLEPSDSVYLSFYYQSGGRGDTSGGEFRDSLVLQYYAPDSMRWQSIWSVSYSEEDTMYERNYLSDTRNKFYTDSLGHRKFYNAIVPVTKKMHLEKGFRFRFKNYASLSDTNEVPSRAGNIDHWHLDFIRLDKYRNFRDTTINDIAFVNHLSPLLNNYESIPWDHFPDANAYEMGNRISITYRNLGDKVWSVFREFAIIDKMNNNDTLETPTGGTGDDIPPYTEETYSRKLDFIFPHHGGDSALFEIQSYLVTDTAAERAPYRWNDTLRYLQKFYNYYAYDDGTAENGYGISGTGSENARVAFRFRTYTPDTLQAIQMYFNQTLNEASRNSFKLMIWEDDNGRPGQLIYQQDGFRPVYEDSVNQFHNYVLKEKPYLEGGYFFVGYQKYSTEMLNVGFDANNVNNDKMYYNTAGSWISSQVKGTLMIRPVFGEHIEYISTAAEEKPDETQDRPLDFDIYPNPARNRLHVDLEDNNYHAFTYSVYNLQGQTVVEERKLNRTVYLEGLPAGIYIIKLRNRQSQATMVKKFLISR